MPKKTSHLSPGTVIGMLTVLEDKPRKPKTEWQYKVQCSCGSEPKWVNRGKLINGKTNSCGCLRGKVQKNKLVLQPGDRYHSWIVLEEDLNKTGAHTRYLCKCECGTIRSVEAKKLTAKKGQRSTSCGCQKNEKISQAMTKHGMSDTPEFKSWARAIDRCENTKNKRYKRYGGRGLSVCKKWRNSFEAFYKDMGPIPSPDKNTIERLDNNKGYYPENCVWDTKKVQANNRSNNSPINEYKLSQSLEPNLFNTKSSDESKAKADTIRKRICAGWSFKDAITKPIKKHDRSINYDLVGKEFGYLTVLSVGHRTLNKKSALCKCVCGREKVVPVHYLEDGHTKSCGCKKAEMQSEASTVHGLNKTPTANNYYNTQERCTNKNSPDYIEAEFNFSSIEELVADIGERPEDKDTFIRVDKTEPYQPGNVRWVTKQEAMWYKDGIELYEFEGHPPMPLKPLAKLYGVSYTTALGRKKKDWDIGDILLTPPRKPKGTRA